MSRSYKIWNSIHGQGKKTSADFGSNSGFDQDVFVGTSGSNSHPLCVFSVRVCSDGYSAHIDGKQVAFLKFDGRDRVGKVIRAHISDKAIDGSVRDIVRDDYLSDIEIID